MGLLTKLFGKDKPVAYSTWHASRSADTCRTCRDLDGACWTPAYEDGGTFEGPPLREGCTCPGGCSCRRLTVYMDEAWGPGNAKWIEGRGGYVSGEQMERFLGS